MSDMKYAIINRDEMKVLYVAQSLTCAQLIADCEEIDSTITIFPLDLKKRLSMFGALELMLLHKNITGNLMEGAIHQYNKLVATCYELVNAMPVDQRSLFDLQKKSASMPPLPPAKPGIPKPPPIISRLSEAQSYAPTVTKAIPKPPRAPSAPGAAPSKGATGKVWTIADRVHAENGGGPITKELRNKIITACEAEGINGGTAATQYGKWKATKS